MIAYKSIIQQFQNLPEQDLEKIKNLMLSRQVIKDKLHDMKNQVKIVALYLTSLRLCDFEQIEQLQKEGIIDFQDFKNLETLSIVSYKNEQNTDNEFLNSNLKEILKLKNLKNLYLHFSNQQMEHYITEEICKFVPFFQQLNSLRLEFGYNDIRDLGCENITKTISQLKNLKILQLGLEKNNLGSYSFENLINMISELDHLEQFQLEFWSNYQEAEAYENIKSTLKGKPICKSLKVLRLSLEGRIFDGELFVNFFEGLSQFICLETVHLQLEVSSIDRKLAQGYNKFILTNKNSLITLISEFTIKPEYYNQQNFQLEMFENLDQIKNLTNLFFNLRSEQSQKYNSIQLFDLFSKCQNLSKLGIVITQYELQQYNLENKVKYFKSLINLNSVLDFFYSDLNLNYDQQEKWHSYYFQQNWKLQHFLDPYLIELVLDQHKQSKNIKKKMQQLLEEEDFNDYESDDSDSYLDSDSDYSSNFSDRNEDSNNKEITSDQINQSQEERRQSIQIECKQPQILSQEKNGYEEYEKKFDEFKVLWNSESIELQLYLITMRQFRFKNSELLRALAYQKQIQQNSEYSQTFQIMRNFWDLYF